MLSLGELAVRFGCELRGDPGVLVEHVATLAGADERSLAFLANPRYKPQLAQTKAAVVVLDAASAAECPTAALICTNPYVTYARIAAVLHARPRAPAGVHPSAVVATSARIDPTASVAAQCVIGERVVIGPRAFVGPQSVLEDGVTLAEDVYLSARIILCHGVEIGARTVIQPGAVIGGDGFGFAPERGRWIKVPQVGSVRVGPDVEIGANTTIDRGSIRNTVIGQGSKIDNLVQIAHNVVIGRNCIVAAQAGIAGSTTLGDLVAVGGQSGIAPHLTIGDGAQIAGASGVTRDIPAGQRWAGFPARPTKKFFRQHRMVELLAEQRIHIGDEPHS